MNDHFFRNLPAFDNFAQACDLAHYHTVPEDWFIVLTDVEGSTKAIQAGRYKDVNMVGAACITAAVNACKGIDIPYVFGGDGATILIPPAYVEAVKKEMLALKRFSAVLYDLPLRVGIVPMQEITKRGKVFQIAKYRMDTGCILAMYRGGGANLADDLVKNHGFKLDDTLDESPPDLTGLSCRWQPVDTGHDTMMTFLVMATTPGQEDVTYERINNKIGEILQNHTNPINEHKLRYSWPTWQTLKDCIIVWNQGNVFKNLMDHIIMIIFFNVINRYNITLKKFDVTQYRKDMISNSDYRKFDDMLRMVVDCTTDQAKKIEDYLKQEHEVGSIAYGIHYSDSALLTCFVVSTDADKHVHFIDGSNGGYALAAKQLKQQLADRG